MTKAKKAAPGKKGQGIVFVCPACGIKYANDVHEVVCGACEYEHAIMRLKGASE